MDWLNSQFPNEWFELVPLGINEASHRAELDFLLTNQAQFFYLSNQNVRWLATLNSPFSANGEQGAVGSSIWVRAESRYRQLSDLKNQTISAVDNDAFGGFSPAQLEFPFVPFRTDKPHGLGLGLVLCQRLMQSLNGQIILANWENGARVVLLLPHK